jgi:methionyl-tRNA synthetase
MAEMKDLAIFIEELQRPIVFCYFCNELVDERECKKADKYNNNDGGDICPKCQKTHKLVIT